MRLRSFTGRTMNEAMGLVRQHLGSDAIIVSTEEDEDVTATRATGTHKTLTPDEHPMSNSSRRALLLSHRSGAESAVEVSSAPIRSQDLDITGYAVHPALLDAGLHAAALIVAGGQGLLPFSWAGTRMTGHGARA